MQMQIPRVLRDGSKRMLAEKRKRGGQAGNFNALKHGRARRIDITLAERTGGLELSVENNGRAIPATQPAKSGMGLNVMRYRAEMIGGSLSIKSGQSKGVRVACTLRRKK